MNYRKVKAEHSNFSLAMQLCKMAHMLTFSEGVLFLYSLIAPRVHSDLENRNVLYNYDRAVPFAQNATYANLIGLRPGQPVGNWRDSNEGLGYGFYPFDVNTALVPASLRATQSLINAGIFPDIGLNAADVGTVADIWEGHAAGLFEVKVNATVAEGFLQDFIGQTNLSTTLLDQENNTSPTDVSFYALSLNTDGTPVEVLNSDTSFNLVYGTNVSQGFLQHVIDALQPYPLGKSGTQYVVLASVLRYLFVGLLTNVGMVVANPAYDSNRTNIEVLNRAAYHGTVVW